MFSTPESRLLLRPIVVERLKVSFDDTGRTEMPIEVQEAIGLDLRFQRMVRLLASYYPDAHFNDIYTGNKAQNGVFKNQQ